jgi:hypothetical protein
MADQPAPTVQRSLVLLVPGFREKPQRNQGLELLVRHFAAFLGCADTTSVNVAGYAGRRVTIRHVQYDLFELYWQDLATQLTDEKVWTQLWRGLILLSVWAGRALRVFRRYWQWAAYLIVGLLVLLFWYWGVIGVGLNSVGSVPWITSKAIVEQAKFVGTWMLSFPVWAVGSLILGALAINVGLIADVTDVITRYFSGSIESNGLTLREQFGAMICQSVSALTGQQRYDTVTIVGHSLGAAIAIDAMAAQHNDWLPSCRLVTLGGFLEFLQSVYPDLKTRMDACMREPKVTAWTDYYATDDPLSSHQPLTTSDAKYAGIKTNNGAGLVDRVTGKSHRYYFKNPQVLQSLA